MKPFLIHGVDLGFDIVEEVIVEDRNTRVWACVPTGHIANRLQCRICGWVTTDHFYSPSEAKEAVLFHSARCEAFDFLDEETDSEAPESKDPSTPLARAQRSP